jgi:hypothetical protein
MSTSQQSEAQGFDLGILAVVAQYGDKEKRDKAKREQAKAAAEAAEFAAMMGDPTTAKAAEDEAQKAIDLAKLATLPTPAPVAFNGEAPAQPDTQLNRALTLAKRGFHVFPLIALTKDQPCIKEWQRRATRDEAQLRSWFKRWPQSNIGISTSLFQGTAGLLVVDVDIKEDRDGEATLRTLVADGYEFPATYEQITHSGGRHLVYRVEKAVKQGVNVLGPGLDIRSKGGYIVAAGSSTAQGEYRAINVLEPAPAPSWLVEKCGKPRERKEGVGAVFEDDFALQRAEDIFNDWPPVIEGERNDNLYRFACKLREIGLSEATITDRAFRFAETKFSEPLEDEEDEVLRTVHSAFACALEAQGSAHPKSHFTVISTTAETNAVPSTAAAEEGDDLPGGLLADLKLGPPREELLGDGWIYDRAITFLLGEPKVGKSFIAQSLALHIAAGAPWLGMTVKAGLIAYVAAEADEELTERAHAAAVHYDFDRTALPYLQINRAVDLFNGEKDEIERIVRKVRAAEKRCGHHIRAFVIDPLQECARGADENSYKDVSKIQGRLRQLQKSLNCALIVVSHTGKDQSRGVRGHSSYEGFADAILTIEKGKIQVRRHRKKAAGAKLGFRLQFVTVEVDGRQIKTGIPFPVASAAAIRDFERKKPSDAAAVVLDVFREVTKIKGKVKRGSAGDEFEDGPPNGVRLVRIEDWRDACFRRRETDGFKNADANRSMFSKMRMELKQLGWIGETADGFAWEVPEVVRNEQ